MKRICCVCNKYLGEKPGPKDAVTHGFCDPCLKIYKAEMMADFDKIDKTRGMDITFVTTAMNDEEAKALLKQFGLPFRD